MRRILTAGTLAYELMFAANAAEARARHQEYWAHSHDHHVHTALRQAISLSACDERRCAEIMTGLRDVLGDSLVTLAQSQLGNGAIYGRGSLWCARFMNWTLMHAGYRGTGSDLAKSFLSLPRTSPRVGAIAVLDRGGRYGHVGIVSGFDQAGNPIIISGNYGHRVGRGVYPRRRVIAYVSPV